MPGTDHTTTPNRLDNTTLITPKGNHYMTHATILHTHTIEGHPIEFFGTMVESSEPGLMIPVLLCPLDYLRKAFSMLRGCSPRLLHLLEYVANETGSEIGYENGSRVFVPVEQLTSLFSFSQASSSMRLPQKAIEEFDDGRLIALQTFAQMLFPWDDLVSEI